MDPRLENLWRMLEEGKITPEQYEALRANLPYEALEEPEGAPPPRPPESPAAAWPRAEGAAPPVTILLSAILFFLVGLASFFAMAHQHGSPSKAFTLGFAGVVEIATGFGLLKMVRWVYLSALILSAMAVLATLTEANFSAVIINAVFLGLLMAAWPHFFPEAPMETWPDKIQKFSADALPVERLRLSPPPIQILAIFLIGMGIFNLARTWFPHSPFTTGQAIIALLIDIALAYGVLRRKRFVFYILIATTALGLIVNLANGAIITICLKMMEAALLYQARDCFPGPSPAPGPADPSPDKF